MEMGGPINASQQMSVVCLFTHITNNKHGDGGPLIQSQQMPVACLLTRISDKTTHHKHDKQSLKFQLHTYYQRPVRCIAFTEHYLANTMGIPAGSSQTSADYIKTYPTLDCRV